MSNLRLENKIAIVTGAGRGMGKATALKLAKEGATVVINDLDKTAAESTAAEIRGMNRESMAIPGDISNEAFVMDMVQTIKDKFKRIDILINNAGILRATKPLETIPLDEWNLMMLINVTGVFLCTRAVLPIMKEQHSGKIVNVSSSAGRTTSTFGGAHYTTSKAAILGFSRHTARETAPYNINVNAVAPGSMDTEMVREMSSPENIKKEEQQIPLRRLGTAQDEANLVAFLCSEDSSYITGATIDINGGDLMM